MCGGVGRIAIYTYNFKLSSFLYLRILYVLPKLTKSKEYKQTPGFLQNIDLKVGLVKMSLVLIRTDIARAVLTAASLNEQHHHYLITQARDPGVIFYFSFSLTHSSLVMKSFLLLPERLPIQLFLCKSLSLLSLLNHCSHLLPDFFASSLIPANLSFTLLPDNLSL